MKKRKKVLIIISIIILVIITGIIIVNNVTYAYVTNEQANTIFTGNAEIKSITNYHITTSDGSNYIISLDELNTVCSKGGTVVDNNGTLIQSGRYQEICDVYINLKKPAMAKTIMSLAISESQVNSSTMTKALIKDSNNDYRYIGADPDNYVRFNGETWRIIGVFNDNTHGKTGQQLVKIIRKDSLGSMPLDYKKSGVGSSDINYGSNDWSDSQLMYMLNGANYLNSGYTTGTTPIHNWTKDSSNYIVAGSNKFYQLKNGSSYLDGATSVCKPASVESGATFICSSLTVNGINATSRAMIEEVTWKLGTANGTNYQSSSNGLASHWYGYERGTTVPTNRPTTWKGKIGLMYPSDYGYATIGNSTTNRTTCLNKELYNWNSMSNCYNNDWLFNSSNNQSTLSPYSGNTNHLFFVDCSGHVTRFSTHDTYSVRPVLYLKSSVSITGGSGTSTDPYTLSM